jgi:hypothetical protein
LLFVMGAGNGRLLTIAQFADIPEDGIWRAKQKRARLARLPEVRAARSCARWRSLALKNCARPTTTYVAPDGSRAVPLIIHHAIFGSVSRFIAILLEHYGGTLPFWL